MMSINETINNLMEIFFLILPGKIISPNLCQTFEKRPEIIFVIQNPVFYNKFGKSALSIFINHYQKHFSPASLTDSFIFFLYQQELKTIKITNQALYNNIDNISIQWLFADNKI